MFHGCDSKGGGFPQPYALPGTVDRGPSDLDVQGQFAPEGNQSEVLSKSICKVKMDQRSVFTHRRTLPEDDPLYPLQLRLVTLRDHPFQRHRISRRALKSRAGWDSCCGSGASPRMGHWHIVVACCYYDYLWLCPNMYQSTNYLILSKTMYNHQQLPANIYNYMTILCSFLELSITVKQLKQLPLVKSPMVDPYKGSTFTRSLSHLASSEVPSEVRSLILVTIQRVANSEKYGRIGFARVNNFDLMIRQIILLTEKPNDFIHRFTNGNSPSNRWEKHQQLGIPNDPIPRPASFERWCPCWSFAACCSVSWGSWSHSRLSSRAKPLNEPRVCNSILIYMAKLTNFHGF